MTRVLLNATDVEVSGLGGDFTYYRDLLALDDPGLDFALVPPAPRRASAALAARAAWRACRASQPATLRRRLLASSRLLPIDHDALEAARPDVVLSHLWFPRLPAGAAVPVVWSSQGISPARYYRVANRGHVTIADVAVLYRRLAPEAACVLVWTEWCAATVRSLVPEAADRVGVAHPPVPDATPVDLAKPSAGDGRLRLLFVGRDALRKGLPETLSAFQVLLGAHPGAELTVVSEPPPALLPTLTQTPGVTFLRSGPGVDVRGLMAQADVLVAPTHADTYALAAVEAMARGCAVVISDLPPLPEVVPDGEAGLTVPTGSVEALVGALHELAADEVRLRRLQQGARRVYERRNAPQVALGRLRAVLDGARGRPRPRPQGVTPAFAPRATGMLC